MKIENRTREEWKEEWNEKNQGHIKQYCKSYRDNHQESIVSYRQEHREKQKEYCILYYKQRAEKLNEKIKCECGCMIGFQHLSNHKKSKKHLKLMEKQLTL